MLEFQYIERGLFLLLTDRWTTDGGSMTFTHNAIIDNFKFSDYVA